MDNEKMTDVMADIDPAFIEEARPGRMKKIFGAAGCAAAGLLLCAGLAFALPKFIDNGPDSGVTAAGPEASHEAENHGFIGAAATEPSQKGNEPTSVVFPQETAVPSELPGDPGPADGAVQPTEQSSANFYGAPVPNWEYSTGSEDPEVIFGTADAVILAKVVSVGDPIPGGSRLVQWIALEPISTVKGDAELLKAAAKSSEGSDGRLNAIVPAGFVKEGESFVFCFNIMGGEGPLVLTAPTGVFSPDSAEGRLLLSK